MLTEWVAGKARLNARKHGVSFADAVVSLEDKGALTMRDPSSDEEQRRVTMGLDCPEPHSRGCPHLARREHPLNLGAKTNAARAPTIRGGKMKREYNFSKAKRGPVISIPKGKTRITIRLDEDVIAWFRTQVERAGGGNYQSLINDALRQHIANAREPLEETLRRVVREEMRRAG
jgi:uncharacterized protein (DUF4415 family)